MEIYKVTFERLYELKKIGNECYHSNDSYFKDLDDLLANSKELYTSLAEELNRLDQASWEYFKEDCHHYLCKKDSQRGWSQLFDKFNEVKGYCYLLDNGCHTIKFIPRSKTNGMKTPDLLGKNQEFTFLCEVKTINLSEKEIKRRNNRTCKEVAYKLNEGLQAQIKNAINEAKEQLNNYFADNVKSRIIYILVCNDDWQSEPMPIVCQEIKSSIQNFCEEGMEIVVTFI